MEPDAFGRKLTLDVLHLLAIFSNLIAMEVSISRPPLTPHYTEYNKFLEQAESCFTRLVSSWPSLPADHEPILIPHTLLIRLYYAIDQNPSQTPNTTRNG